MEETSISTKVKTFTGPKIQEKTFTTFTTITTVTVIQSINYRYTTEIRLSWMGQDQWQTIYYISEVGEYVPVTVTTPIRVKTQYMGLTSLTKLTQTSFLTAYELNVVTRIMFETIILTKTLETLILEESVKETPEQLFTLFKDYWLIILAVIIIALAFIPKKIFKRIRTR